MRKRYGVVYVNRENHGMKARAEKECVYRLNISIPADVEPYAAGPF
jgi:beta-glucosidase/6-phospho-beta-glucosidase/beta-galactosidase